jgi:hypothetical protein
MPEEGTRGDKAPPTKPDSAEALSIGPLPRESRDERQPDSSRSSFHSLSGQQGSLAAALSGKQPWEDWFRISSRGLALISSAKGHQRGERLD